MASEHLALERVVELAEEFVSAHVFDDELIYKIVLLTSEAFTNAIEHGNHLDPEKKVTVEFSAEPDCIEIWIEDEGNGFVRKKIGNPLDRENLLDDSGRGIFLIEQMADKVVYEGDGRRIGMVFQLPDKG